jgi:putative peptide zinc metalloprotease protein
MVENNQTVTIGTPLLILHDPFLRSEARIAQARVQEMEAHYRAGRANDNIQAGIAKGELRVAESELQFIQEKSSAMSVDAFKNGELVLLEADDLPGRFLRKGDLLGYIIDDEQPTVRMAVSQDHIGQLRHKATNIKIRFASEPGRDFNARILRQAPEATNRLPSAALATTGGGPFVVTADGENQLETEEKVFLVDLKPDFEGREIPLGTRAFVRVNHGSEALASQWYRRLRQVFLRQFNV